MPNTRTAPEPPTEPPALPPGPKPEPPVRSRRWGRIIALTTLSLLGLSALSVGGVALGLELTRKPTTAEIDAAGTKELANRWRIRPAGEIFPPTIDYTITANGYSDLGSRIQVKARRVGIASATRCADALDEKAAEILVEHGCLALLRATYVDASETLVTTLGIAVLPNSDKAAGAESGFNAIGGVHSWHDHGLRAVGFPRTVTERFGDAQRQQVWMANNSTPYVFFRASGWTDGRTKVAERELAEEFDFAGEITDKVIATFVRADEPCKAKGVQC